MTEMSTSIELDERGLVMACAQCGQRNRLAYERLIQTFRCGQCHTEFHSPAEPVEVRTEGHFALLIERSPLPVLVDFWAAWCGPCKLVAPELVKVAAAGRGRWLVAKVSTEELPNLAHRYGIHSIPTLAVFRHGREVARQAGAMSAPAIQRFLENAPER